MTPRDIERFRESRRFWPGHTSELRRSSFGSTLNPRAAAEWRHPWEIDVTFEEGGWRAVVNPGFVNARPAFIHMPATWLAQQVSSGAAHDTDFGINPLTGKPYFSAWVFQHESATPHGSRVRGDGGPVRITNSPLPCLILDDWRNPAASASVSEEGRAHRAEGYPRFFEGLGVRPASKGGPLAILGTGGDDATGVRTREIRAMDVVLRQPRASTGLLTEPVSPLGTTAFLEFQTTYAAPPDTRATLRAVPQYTPILGAPGDAGPGGIPGIFGLLLNQGDAQFDEILMATIWMVSPPDAGEPAVPDAKWEPYVQHFVFWNLNWANKVAIEPDLGPQPITLPVPLLGGVAQPLIDSLLALINQGFSEAINFVAVELAARMSGGRFWTT
jgi:hypothetical protein